MGDQFDSSQFLSDLNRRLISLSKERFKIQLFIANFVSSGYNLSPWALLSRKFQAPPTCGDKLCKTEKPEITLRGWKKVIPFTISIFL